MQRPQSIINFERFFLGNLLLSLIFMAINWGTMQDQIAAQPNSGILPSWFLPVTLIFSYGINLLLWYFVARGRSVVAKWFIVVLFGFGLLSLPAGLLGPSPIFLKLTSLIGIVLSGLAVWMLFRKDSVDWLAGKSVDHQDIFS